MNAYPLLASPQEILFGSTQVAVYADKKARFKQTGQRYKLKIVDLVVLLEDRSEVSRVACRFKGGDAFCRIVQSSYGF